MAHIHFETDRNSPLQMSNICKNCKGCGDEKCSECYIQDKDTPHQEEKKDTFKEATPFDDMGHNLECAMKGGQCICDQKKDSWEEEFDRRWDEDETTQGFCNSVDAERYANSGQDADVIKSFISQQLTKVKQQTISSVIEEIEGMKKDNPYWLVKIEAYNQALEDLKTLLTKEKNDLL